MDTELLKKLTNSLQSSKAAESSEAVEPDKPKVDAEQSKSESDEPKVEPPSSESDEKGSSDDKSEFFKFLNSLVEQPAEQAQPQPTASVAQPAQPTQPAAQADSDYGLSGVVGEDGAVDLKKLHDALKKAEESAYKRATTDLTRDLYPVMQQVAMNVVAWGMAAARFRAKNEDLEPAMQFVAQQSNRIAAAHPDWSPERVFDEAGRVTRKAIEYFVQQQNGKTKKPAFAPAPGAKAEARKPKEEDPHKAFMRRLLKWEEQTN